MKAIETSYNGYKFRSRLEARWAVFFDTCRIPYLYESEGYDLDGIWYLPDFRLVDQNTFIEIKGQEPTDEEIEKARRLCQYTRVQVAIFVGDPWFNRAYLTFRNVDGNIVDISENGESRWRTCSIVCSGCNAACSNTPTLCTSIAPADFGDPDSPILKQAYTAARQARF